MDPMNDILNPGAALQGLPAGHRPAARSTRRWAVTVLAVVFMTFTAGCQTSAVVATPAPAQSAAEGPPPAQSLREGDVVQVSFPGAPSLDTKQQIRMDGRITLPIIGDVVAAGLTPAELQKELVKQYAPQLVSKEVTVTVASSTFSVVVSGAVMHPGKVVSDRPLSALDAVMLAGGFDPSRANMKAVLVIRQEGKHTQRFTVDLRGAISGQPGAPFPLEQGDIVYVPQKFSWF